MVLEKLEPKNVWQIFEEVFTKTPRPSKKEEKIRRRLKEWIAKREEELGIDLSVTEDEAGNILIKKQADSSMENVPSVILQGHLDMVCETDRKGGFDFENKPIPVRIQENGEWVDADETTLGADNGIGMALGLAILTDPDVKHGPLEILATVDEETGLTGAFALDPEEMGIESKLLINLDSEDVGVITIGSAGGGDTVLEKKIQKFEPRSDDVFLKISVSGLQGGHSGVDIHEPRANANKLVARCLSVLLDEIEVRLSSWNGGGKRNAIPRESNAVFAIRKEKADEARNLIEDEISAITDYYGRQSVKGDVLEPEIKVSLTKTKPASAFNTESSTCVIRTIHSLPHGPLRFSPSVEDLVETSNNVAVISTDEHGIELQMSSRSSIQEELESVRRRLVFIGKMGGWVGTRSPAYPGWAPNPRSPFLQFICKKYEKVYGSDVIVEAIHAGLECGILGAGIPGLQMVSIGPTIKNPHSPDEKLKIGDVDILYNVLKSVLSDIGNMES
jgi:dipeptidase D